MKRKTKLFGHSRKLINKLFFLLGYEPIRNKPYGIVIKEERLDFVQLRSKKVVPIHIEHFDIQFLIREMENELLSEAKKMIVWEQEKDKPFRLNETITAEIFIGKRKGL